MLTDSSLPTGRLDALEDRHPLSDRVYQRLKDDFVLQERGAVAVKGKGVMRTWYLVGRKPDTGSGDVRAEAPQAAGV